MADQKKAGMISGMDPLAVLTGDELMEVSQLGRDGVWRTYSILVNKIRTNQGLSAYEVAVKNGFQGTEEEWLETLVGKSAYEIAVELGYTGTEAEWLKTLVGPSAYQEAVEQGYNGTEAEWLESLKGQSVYQLAVQEGFDGSEAEYLESIKGKSAYEIAREIDPSVGTETEWLESLIGDSAYEVALANGFVGTEAAWLQSLKGQSAYQIWVAQGNVGTEADFVSSLKGETGESAYDIWEAQAGNAGKTEAEFLESLKGTDGTDGTNGENGASAYEIAVEQGFVGTEAEWLESLKGADGTNGTDGTNGEDGASAYQLWESQPGNVGKTEADFLESLKGETGESAYEVAVADGFSGTEAEWLESLKGTDGASAYDTYKAQPGNANKTEEEFLASLKGQSAYQTWLALPGNSGKTEDEFIASLKGAKGDDGRSAYEVWVAAGNIGSETVFLNSLKGKDGTNGTNGTDGTDGQSINVIANVTQEDFDLIVQDDTSRQGDAYVVDTFIYIYNGEDWVKSNSIQGPQGKGLNYLGTWPTGGSLPNPNDVNYKAGDTYVWGATAGNISLWTLVTEPTRSWVDIGVPGPSGKSAYQSWLDAGNTGTELQFVASLQGKSAYQIWQAQAGNAGKTEAEFLESIKGTDGTNGASAYQLWVAMPGNEGKDQAAFFAEMKGATGDEGPSAYEVWEQLPGNTGKTEAEYIQAITGPIGPKGLPAVAFTIVGQLGSADQLPAVGNPTEAYYVGSNLYVWVEDEGGGSGEWQDFGSMNGESAFQLWQKQPGNESKTEQDFIDFMHGDSAYEIAVQEGFVGTESAWLESLKGKDGTNGANLQVDGTKADSTEILAIANPGNQEAWIANDTGHLWIYNGDEWIDAGPFRGQNGTDGENGASAYEVAVEAGFVGDEAAWLESLKGADGTNGTNGTDGENGASAYQVAVDQGFVGTEAEWLASLKGADGTNGTDGANGRNVEVKGSLPDLAAIQALPSPQPQDAYTAQDTNSLYMYINGSWTFLGKFQGEKGEVGQEGPIGKTGIGLNIVAEVETLAERDAFLGGSPGDAVYVLEDHKLYQLNEAGVWNPGVDIQGPTGEQGVEGPMGPMGPAIQIMGSYETEAALIAAVPVGTPGEGYLVGADLYLYGVNPDGGATEWYNAGPVQGPQGPQGVEGPRGLRGIQGQKGERGSLWLTLPPGQDAPTAVNGVQGDWAVNESHRIFYKSTDTVWVDMGPLVAGDVNSPLLAEGKVVRLGNSWVPLPVDYVPSPVEGTQYVMVGNDAGGTDWAVLTIPDAGVPEVPALTTIPQGRTSDGWVDVIALPTGLDATKRYVYMNGAFALSPIQADAPSQVDVALCYSVNASGVGTWVKPTFDAYSLKQDTTARTASFTPDFTLQQTFRINAANAVTVTLPTFTSARTLMAVFVVEGTANKLAFAAGSGAALGFNNGTAAADIEYGASQTVITAFWNGFGTWIISKGPSF